MTVASFVGLAEGTIHNDAFSQGTPFFDGSTFHRVVSGHVIQGGIPNSERARGSGTRIPNEIHADLGHGRAGMVGMANGGPHTATNQFYITVGDRSYLDGNYTVFGEVVQGIDVVRSTVVDDAIENIRIVRVGAAAEAFRPTDTSFRWLAGIVRGRVRVKEERERREDENFVRRNWPNAVTTETGWSYRVLEEGDGQPAQPGDSLTVSYTGSTVRGLEFASSRDDGDPTWLGPENGAGEPFGFVVGTDSVTTGFDDAVAQMRNGEKRVVIVPAALGYATGGYYAPAVPGQRRFVISPNTMLVYEIEILGTSRQ